MRIVHHVLNHASTDWISPNIPRHVLKDRLSPQHVVVIAPLPQPTMPVTCCLLEMLCEAHKVRVIISGYKQVEVVWHEAVCDDLEAVPCRACR